jgi:hypothetical protein
VGHLGGTPEFIGGGKLSRTLSLFALQSCDIGNMVVSSPSLDGIPARCEDLRASSLGSGKLHHGDPIPNCVE